MTATTPPSLTVTCIPGGDWTGYLVYDVPAGSSYVKFWWSTDSATGTYQAEVSANISGSWSTIYTGTDGYNGYTSKSIGSTRATQVRIRVYRSAAGRSRVNEIHDDTIVTATGVTAGEYDVTAGIYYNLVTNGSFATDTTGWGTTRSTATRITGADSYDGASCNITSTAQSAYIDERLDGETQYNGKTLTLAARVKALSTNDKTALLRISEIGGTPTTSDSAAIPKDDAWHWVSVSRTIIDATFLRVQLMVNSTAVADTDDILTVDQVIWIVSDSAPTGGNLYLDIDGTAVGVWADQGFSIPDNDSPLIFAEAAAMPYMESAYVEIDSVTVAGPYAYEHAATFSDPSGNGHTATPTWRTASSDSDVSTSLISFTPISQATASSTAGDWPEMWTSAPTQPTTMYTENSTPGVFFYSLVHTLWSAGPGSGATPVDESFFWYGFAFFWIIVPGMLIYWAFVEKSKQSALLIKIILMMAIMIFWALPGPNIYGMYVAIYMGMWCFGIMVLSKNYGW